MTTELSHPKDRLLDAAYEVFAERGVSQGTMGDVAAQAGVGRATLYRYFPGKDALIAALILREARDLFAMLDGELGADEDTQSLFERGLLAALAHLRSHTLLQRILREEPESILPFLTVQGAPLLEAAVDFAAPYIERAGKTEHLQNMHPRAAAEWGARVLLSLLLTPSVVVDLDDPRQLKQFLDWVPLAFRNKGGNA